MLHTLANRSPKVVSREQLVQTLYSWDDNIDSNTIEVHIHNLRKKISTSNVRIKTIRGVGYTIETSTD